MNNTEQPGGHPKRKGCLRTLARTLAGVILAGLVLAVVGYLYERYASARDMAQYPPPGRRVMVDDHNLRLYCTGVGSPTVILETQANSSSLDWGYVQPEIARFTRVCSYDRAGFGWSELGPPPRTARQAASELESLLRAAGETGPYVLVGASYGGHIVRLYANDHPDQVEGVVLVDTRPEKLYSIPAIRRQANAALVFARAIVFLADLGVARLGIAWVPEKMIPPAAVPLYSAQPGSYAIVFQAKMWHAIYDEAVAIETSDQQVASVQSMGDTPLVVIRHGKPMSSSMSPQEAEDMERQWQAFQEEIAAQSSDHEIIVAEASGHGIQFEQPSVIVKAVQQLVEKR